MISFTTSQPVHWPPAVSPVVAPVTIVPGVTPAKAISRDAQTGTNTGGRDSQTQATRTASGGKVAADPAAKAAPLLPREQAEGGRENAPSSQTDAAEKAERLEAETQSQDKAAQKLQLQDVLSSVWKASAAVVDVVLGREQQLQAAAAAESTTGVGLSSGAIAVAASATGTNPATGTAVHAAPALPGEGRNGQEPVAYTVQGASSWAPLEAGSLISRRV